MGHSFPIILFDDVKGDDQYGSKNYFFKIRHLYKRSLMDEKIYIFAFERSCITSAGQ